MNESAKITFDKNVYEFVAHPDKPAEISSKRADKQIYKSLKKMYLNCGIADPSITRILLLTY